MNKKKVGEFRSSIYENRPAYADFDSRAKCNAIISIIGRRLLEHPNATCSYSGGSDSDIMLDMIYKACKLFGAPIPHFAFINTGLEMEATKRHVKEQSNRYGVDIHTYRPKKGIVKAVHDNGIPFVSKIMSEGLSEIQKKQIPLSIHDEYWNAEDKASKREELRRRYPKAESAINFLCCCNTKGEPRPDIQLVINSSAYMLDFIKENPIPFRVSNKCCDICKKQIAHEIEKNFEMVITGERRDEGGMRSVPRGDSTSMCFAETSRGTYRLRPLYYMSDKDKAWYKEYANIRYSDAYEVYGLKRTGCCGCAISARAVKNLELIRSYEPQLVKAAWSVFGESYRYRQRYEEYRRMKQRESKLGDQILLI